MILRRMLERDAPQGGQESAPESAEQQQSSSQEVEKARKSTRQGIENVAGDAIQKAPGLPLWKKSLPKPNIKAAGKTAMLTGAIIAPPVAATAAVGYFGWKGLRQLPGFSHIDKAGKSLFNGVKNLAGNVTETATYPFRLGGRLAMNALETGSNAVGTAFNYGVVKPFKSIERGLGYQLEDGERTNILASTVILAKKAVTGLIKYPFRIGESMFDQIDQHPIKASIGGLLIASAFADWSGFLAGGSELFHAIVKAISSIGG